jgi:hypothetical protein
MTGFGFRPEELSEPLLRAELRQVRGDMEKLIARYEMLTTEFDRRHANSNGTKAATEVPALADLVKLDDSALIAWRRETSAELERNPDEGLQVVYDATTQEIATRAEQKWTGGGSAS